MKLLSLVLLFTGMSFSFAQDNILAMQGCYNVTFEFEETETASGVKPSGKYLSRAKELVVIEKNTAEEIHLQHILISKGGIIKHWRQQWYSTTFKAQNIMVHKSPNFWELENFPQVNDVWVQYVSNTDDAPRYACAAAWNGNSWKCTDFAPLPRREYTKRSDYNMMIRGNDVVVTDQGWVHFQENIKMMMDENNVSKIIGKEVGKNTYVKINDQDCAEADLWWSKRRQYWKVVQDMWSHIFEGHNPLMIDVLKGDKPLYEKLDSIVEENLNDNDTNREATLKKIKKLAHDVIHEYFLDH